jgi:hypothetical protein
VVVVVVVVVVMAAERPTMMLPAHWVEAVVCEVRRETTSTSGAPLVKVEPGAMATGRAKSDVEGVGGTVGEGDGVGVMLLVALGDDEMMGLTDIEAVGDLELDTVGARDTVVAGGVSDTDAEADGVGEGVGDTDAEAEGVSDTERVTDCVRDTEADAEDVGDTNAGADGVTDTEGLADGVSAEVKEYTLSALSPAAMSGGS